MRLLVVVDRLWPCDHAFLEEVIARELPARGHTVEMLFRATSSETKGVFAWHGARVLAVGGGSYTRGLIKQAGAMRESVVRERPDVVMVRNDPLLGRWAGRNGWPPLVFQLSHQKEETLILGFCQQPAPQTALAGAKGLLARWLRRSVMRRAAGVFPVSETLRDWLSESGERKGAMTVVPLGAARIELPTNERMEALRRELHIRPDQTFVLYLGTLNRLRGLTVLLEALTLLRHRGRDAVLVFVGEGPSPEDRRELELKSQRLEMVDFVRFTGRVPRYRTTEYIATADIGLSYFPQHRLFQQNSPTKVMEYLAAGLPVVVTPQPEHERIIEATQGGLIARDFGAHAFAHACEETLDREWDRSAIRERFLAERSYGWIAERVEQGLQEAVDGARASL